MGLRGGSRGIQPRECVHTGQHGYFVDRHVQPVIAAGAGYRGIHRGVWEFSAGYLLHGSNVFDCGFVSSPPPESGAQPDLERSSKPTDKQETVTNGYPLEAEDWMRVAAWCLPDQRVAAPGRLVFRSETRRAEDRLQFFRQ